MKTEFEFGVTLGHARLEAPIESAFGSTGFLPFQEGDAIIMRQVEDFRIAIALRPDPKETSWNSARLFITMAGHSEELEPLARQIALDIAENMTFHYQEFQLDRNLVSAKSIPENEQEMSEVGERPYTLQFVLEEVGEPPTVDAKHFVSFPKSFGVRRALYHYNAARQAKNQIEAYSGMFKVLETVGHTGQRKAADALKQSVDVREALRGAFKVRPHGEAEFRVPDDAAVDRLIDDLVHIRNRCAHFRERSGFGYAPHDGEVQRQVRFNYNLIESAARRLLEQRMNSGSTNPDDSLKPALPKA